MATPPQEHDQIPYPSEPATKGSRDVERNRWETLIRLLEDDSPVVLAEVRAQFRRGGQPARRALERAVRSGSARQRARARQLLTDKARQQIVKRLLRRATAGVKLESALFLLDNFYAPGLDTRPYRKALDAMADKVRRAASTKQDASGRAHALVEVLTGELGFRGAVEDFHHPDNIFLWRSIEKRRGMPLTLCAIYSFVAERAGLKTSLLPFPGHVLLRLHVGSRKQSQIVDPFGGGQILSEGQCLSYLSEHKLPYRPEWFEAASDAALFERHVCNLARSCQGRGRGGEARELNKVLAALTHRRV